MTTAQRQFAALQPVATAAQKRFAHDIIRTTRSKGVVVSKGFGGRSSVAGQIATVFGSTGFFGRYVTRNLAKQGVQVVCPYRGAEDDKRHLKVMGDLGQVVQPRFDIRNDEQIYESLRHSNVVYNLIGRDYPTKNFTFEQVNVDGARRIARIAKEAGVAKLIHVSALNARPSATSEYLRTKWQGEQAVLEEFPSACIVRPANTYGNEDRFWNRLGFLMKSFPLAIPIINAGKAKLRPVYVGDVAEVLGRLATDDRAENSYIELYGPIEYQLKDLVEFFQKITINTKVILPVPDNIAKFVFGMYNRITSVPFITEHDVDRLNRSDILDSDAMTFDDFNIKPHTVEETMIRFAALYREGDAWRERYSDILDSRNEFLKKKQEAKI